MCKVARVTVNARNASNDLSMIRAAFPKFHLSLQVIEEDESLRFNKRHQESFRARTAEEPIFSRATTIQRPLARTPVSQQQLPKRSCIKPCTSSQLSSETRQHEHHRQVHFSDVSIRRYDVEVGDNPGCTAGIPLALGWNYLSQPTIFIDDYEELRGCRRTPKRLLLGRKQRETLLLGAGFSSKELQRAKQQVAAARRGRIVTNMLHRLHHAEEILEDTGKNLTSCLISHRHF